MSQRMNAHDIDANVKARGHTCKQLYKRKKRCNRRLNMKSKHGFVSSSSSASSIEGRDSCIEIDFEQEDDLDSQHGYDDPVDWDGWAKFQYELQPEEEITQRELSAVVKCLKRPKNASLDADIISNQTAVVESVGLTRGLDAKSIHDVGMIATNSLYSDNICCRLLCSMIPCEYVQELTVIHFISKLSTRKLSLALQNTMLEWLIIIYDYIDNSRHKIHSLYGVLFHLLDYEMLIPRLCQLLQLLTRKQDARLYRAKKLFMLQKHLGSSKEAILAVVGLISTYKIYLPSIVSLKTISVNFFPSLNVRWVARVKQIRKNNLSTISPTQQYDTKQEHLHESSIEICNPEAKNEKSSVMYYFEDNNNTQSMLHSSSIFSSQYLQYLLSCNADQEAKEHLTDWIEHNLIDIFGGSPFFCCGKKQGEELTCRIFLRSLVKFTRLSGSVAPTVGTFLAFYLKQWNGVDYLESILDLLSMLYPTSYETLYGHFLLPLHDVFFSSRPPIKAHILHALVGLIEHYATLDWRLHYASIDNDIDTHCVPSAHGLAYSTDSNIDYMSTLFELTQYVTRLAVVALDVTEQHVSLQHESLLLLEVIVKFSNEFGLPFIMNLPVDIIFRCILSQNIMAISRTCSILVQYNEAIQAFRMQQLQDEHIMATPSSQNPVIDVDPVETIDFVLPSPKSADTIDSVISTFNEVVTHILDCLWQRRPPRRQSKHIRDFHDNQSTSTLTLASIFSHINSHQLDAYNELQNTQQLLSLAYHMPTILYAWKCLHQERQKVQKNQNNVSTVQPAILLSGHGRVGLLNFLREHGANGLYDFISTFSI